MSSGTVPMGGPMDSASDIAEEKGDKRRSCCSAFSKAQNENPIVKARRGLCSCLPWSDIPILIIFVGFLIGLFYVFGKSVADGNINRIQYGTDYAGNACGDSDSGTSDFKHQYWANPLYYSSLGSVCLDACPSNGTSGTSVYCVCNNQLTVGRTETGVANSLSNTSTGFLASDCNSDTCVNCAAKGKNWVRYDSAQLTTAVLTGDVNDGIYYYLPTLWLANYTGGMNGDLKWMVPQCMYAYDTYQLLNRCVPSVSNYEVFCPANSTCQSTYSDYTDYINSYAETGSQVLGDLEVCFWVILGSFGIAVVMGFLWVKLMEKSACCVVWVVILLAIVMTAVVTAGFMYFGVILNDRCNQTPQLATYDTDQRNMYICFSFGGVFGAIELILLCCVVCYCKQINQAIKLVELASEAVMDFPYLIFYPVVQIMGLIALIVCWVIGAAFLGSSGDLQTDATYGTVSWTYSDEVQYMAWYWLFGLLWIGELLVACGFMIVAFCFGMWFFSEEVEVEDNGKSCCANNEPKRAIPSWVLLKAMKFTYWNHLGTCAFGALIMAIIDFLRIIVEYVEKKQKEYGQEPPIVWKYIFYCFKSCLACLDKCMRFLNKNAYVQTMINGTGLCSSACRAVVVMFNNLALFAIMTTVEKGIFFFGKFAIAMSTAGISALIIDAAYKDDISSIVGPTLVCMFIGYIIATAFIGILDMGIDTMLMCFSEATNGNSANEFIEDKHIPKKLRDEVDEAQKKVDEKNQESGKAGPIEGSQTKDAESQGQT